MTTFRHSLVTLGLGLVLGLVLGMALVVTGAQHAQAELARLLLPRAGFAHARTAGADGHSWVVTKDGRVGLGGTPTAAVRAWDQTTPEEPYSWQHPSPTRLRATPAASARP